MTKLLRHISWPRLLTVALLHSMASAQTLPRDNWTRVQIERLARTSHYFSQSVVIENRRLSIVGPDFKTSLLAYEQDALANSLRAVDDDRASLAALLQDADPEVRTMALGALFEREDGRDLPLIATLANDKAETLADLHDSMSSAPGPRPMSELESPQTVGKIAKTMLRFWMGPSLASSAPQTETFAEYWKHYAGRDYAASWFAVKMRRATGGGFPSGPVQKPLIQSVLYQIDAVPSPDREWIRLYVLYPEMYRGNHELWREQRLVSEEELVATAKRLGPEALLRFLQHKKVSDDPDLGSRDCFGRISEFILLHADQLLRPQDAEALSAQEKAEVVLAQNGVDPSWAIARAKLEPALALEILQTEIAGEPKRYDGAVGDLAGAMWEIRGPAAIAFLKDWFYRSPPPPPGLPWEQPVVFLIQVKDAARPDTKQLMQAIVNDPRFDQTNQNELRKLLEVANTQHALVDRDELYHYLQHGPEEQELLVRWRGLLRREYAAQR